MAKRQKPMAISMSDVMRSIRKPLPKQTGGAHVPKTAYRRKQVKDVLRGKIKSRDWD